MRKGADEGRERDTIVLGSRGSRRVAGCLGFGTSGKEPGDAVEGPLAGDAVRHGHAESALEKTSEGWRRLPPGVRQGASQRGRKRVGPRSRHRLAEKAYDVPFDRRFDRRREHGTHATGTGGKRSSHAIFDAVRPLGADFLVEIEFVTEVMVQRPGGHPGGPRDGCDLGAVVAMLFEGRPGGADQPVPGRTRYGGLIPIRNLIMR